MFKSLILLSLLALPGLANAAACNGFQTQAKKMSAVAKAACEAINKTKKLNLPCDQVEILGDTIDNIVKVLKQAFPIGPQVIQWGKSQSGTIVSTGKRIWYTNTASNKNSLTVRLSKTKQNNKAVRVNICTATKKSNGGFSVKQISSFTTDKSVTKSVSGVKSKWVAVEIIGQKIPKNFKYSLRVTK